MNIKSIFLIFYISLLSGCTSLSLNPDPVVCKGNNSTKIASYSYSFERREKPFDSIQNDTKSDRKQELYYKAYDEIDNETKSKLQGAILLKEIPHNNKKPHLHITSQYTQDPDSCSYILVSMYTAFLVPMWCTAPDAYTLKFETYISGNVVRTNIYTVNKTGYVHLVLFPFSILQPLFTPSYEPLPEYTTALNSFISNNCH